MKHKSAGRIAGDNKNTPLTIPLIFLFYTSSTFKSFLDPKPCSYEVKLSLIEGLVTYRPGVYPTYALETVIVSIIDNKEYIVNKEKALRKRI